MYIPSDDSFFIANAIKGYKGKNALEIGVGSGLLLEILLRNFETVMGTDIHLGSLIYSSRRLDKKIMILCCDAASALNNVEFDLIVSNPPYLHSLDLTPDLAVCGGSSGVEVPIRFVNSSIDMLSCSGKAVILLSDCADLKKFYGFLISKKLKFKQIGSKRLFFEKLLIVEITNY